MDAAKEQFIQSIADAVKVLAPKYGICVVSPIVAQACLESAYGTSEKAKHHNYFGLKYRKDRVSCHSGYFSDGGSEQNADGSYTPIQTDWYAFADLFSGVEGYMQFINIDRYKNLKGVTDPHRYLELIKEDEYATSLDYVVNVWRVVETWNLTKYDKEEGTMKYTAANPPLQCFMRQSSWYKGAGSVEVKGVLWHSTGANNPTLKRYVQPDDNAADKAKMLALLGMNQYKNDWNHIEHQAGVNAWIGKLASGEVTTVQAGPWDKKAWGCGSGSKGSCNNGWIQFEICEDALNDKDYFDKVYKEAVELTAYLCKLYGLDPNGTVMYNGVKVPVILCHADSCKLGLGSNHGDVLHWFPKFGKSMQTARDDVAALLKQTTTTPAASNTTIGELYRVRKTWNDSKSQIGAYASLDNAKDTVNKNPGYAAFNSAGVQVYPAVATAKPEENTGNKASGVYQKLGDVPSAYRPTIKKLMEKGALGGYSDPDPNDLEDNIINVSEDYCRVMVSLDRLGVLDK